MYLFLYAILMATRIRMQLLRTPSSLLCSSYQHPVMMLIQPVLAGMESFLSWHEKGALCACNVTLCAEYQTVSNVEGRSRAISVLEAPSCTKFHYITDRGCSFAIILFFINPARYYMVML